MPLMPLEHPARTKLQTYWQDRTGAWHVIDKIFESIKPEDTDEVIWAKTIKKVPELLDRDVLAYYREALFAKRKALGSV